MNKVFLAFPQKEQAYQLSLESHSYSIYEQKSLHNLNAQHLQNNLFIRCDNLVALQTLQNINHQFDFIYIDPPYNSSSQFTFNDNYQSQENWLSFMYSRLLLAHKCLSEHGIFFVSIDDREVASLTLLLREIFGSENHIGTIKWRKKRKASFLKSHFASVIEYVLVFSKNKKKLLKLKGPMTDEKTRPVLNASNSISARILPKNMKCYCADGTYPSGIYKNRTLEFEAKSEIIIKNGLLQNDVEVLGRFRVNQEILNETVFITSFFGLRRTLFAHEKKFKHATDDATVHFETNEDAQSQLKGLLEHSNVFEFPKPVGLIKNLLKMYDCSKNIISCCDFFAGSATLAQAVHELNLENKEKQFTFCCIQNEEAIQKESQYKTIADIAQKRIETVEENLKIEPKCQIFMSL